MLYEVITPDTPSNMTLAIHGTEGMAIQLARCCQPIPGDPIIGSIRKGSGLVIHTHDCPSIRKSRSSEPQKWIDVEWDVITSYSIHYTKLYEAKSNGFSNRAGPAASVSIS